MSRAGARRARLSERHEAARRLAGALEPLLVPADGEIRLPPEMQAQLQTVSATTSTPRFPARSTLP